MAEKEKTPEELDKEIQAENQKKSEARAKLVDDFVNRLKDEFDKGNYTTEGLNGIVHEIADKVSRIQVVAAGAVHGPTPAEMEDLRRTQLPVVAPPMSDGTPIANIAQAQKPGDKPEQPQEFVPKKTTSPAADTHAKKK